MGAFDANLRNVTPMDLNFLLYVRNVYLSQNTEHIRFPGPYPGKDATGFLPYERFADIMKKSWDPDPVGLQSEHFPRNRDPAGGTLQRLVCGRCLRKAHAPNAVGGVQPVVVARLRHPADDGSYVRPVRAGHWR